MQVRGRSDTWSSAWLRLPKSPCCNSGFCSPCFRGPGSRLDHHFPASVPMDDKDGLTDVPGADDHGPTPSARDDEEFVLHPTGSEEEGWDYGAESPDDDSDNADWTKQTPDTMAAIEAQLAVAPRRLLFLRGSAWYVWLDYKTLEWATDNPDAVAATTLLSEQFSPSLIRQRGETDQAFRALYDDAVSFLQNAGVRTRVVG